MRHLIFGIDFKIWYLEGKVLLPNLEKVATMECVISIFINNFNKLLMISAVAF